MDSNSPIPGRRARRYFYMATAILSLALWLMMAVAEAWPSFHAWLHGGSIPDDDDCPVAMIQHGKVDCAVVAVTMVLAAEIIVFISAVFSAPFVASLPLPDVRGPPSCRPADVPA